MPIERVATIPQIGSVDATRAREFYCDFLGLKVDFEHRYEPYFGGGTAVIISDPFGNRIQFVEDQPS